ncbi:hypothetical protein, partial [Actinoplanes philippinensis]|uniref:hypothetical protein n=1 Tax=Actinoplanes philippinensis TaxID=35752 RepID=UPI0033EF0806
MQAEDGTDSVAITGRHRAGHRWWRLAAAAAAVVVVAVVTTVQIAGAGDPAAHPRQEGDADRAEERREAQ